MVLTPFFKQNTTEKKIQRSKPDLDSKNDSFG